MPNYPIQQNSMVKVQMFNFGGGLNLTEPKTEILDTELTEAKNIIIEGGSPKTRQGIEKIGSTIGTAAKITGLGNYHQDDGDDYSMAAYSTKVYYDASGTWTDCTNGGSTVTAGHNVEFQNFINKIFMVNGYDILSSWNGTVAAFTTYANLPVTGATLGSEAAAAVACTFDDNGGASTDIVKKATHGLSNGDRVRFSQAGVLPAGLNSTTTYYVVNKDTDYFKVSLTSGGSAVDLQDDGSGSTSYYRIADIPHYITFFKDRLIMANTDNYPTRVYFSDQLATTIESTSYFDIDAPVTGLIVYQNYLFIHSASGKVYKVDSFIFASGVTQPESVRELPIGNATVSHRSLKVVNSLMYWVGKDDIYVSDGSNCEPIGTTKIKKLFDRLNLNKLSIACAGVHNKRYYLGLSMDGSATNNVIFVFDTINKAWTYYKGNDIKPSCFATLYDESKAPFLAYGSDIATEGKVYKLESGLADLTDYVSLPTNASFETGGAGSTPTGWTQVQEAGGSGTAQCYLGNSSLGSYSLQINNATALKYTHCTQNLTVTAEKTYVLSGHVIALTSAGIAYTNTTYPERVRIEVCLTASPYTQYGKVNMAGIDTSGGEYFYGLVTIPAGVTAVTIKCVVDEETTVAYFDDVKLTQVCDSNLSYIEADLQTKAYGYGNLYENKKFKKTFVSARSSEDYHLDDDDYNLTFGYSAGIDTAFTTKSIDLDASADISETYQRTSVKGKHIRYQFYNNGLLEPFQLYGFTSVFIPLNQLK